MHLVWHLRNPTNLQWEQYYLLLHWFDNLAQIVTIIYDLYGMIWSVFFFETYLIWLRWWYIMTYEEKLNIQYIYLFFFSIDSSDLYWACFVPFFLSSEICLACTDILLFPGKEYNCYSDRYSFIAVPTFTALFFLNFNDVQTSYLRFSYAGRALEWATWKWYIPWTLVVEMDAWHRSTWLLLEECLFHLDCYYSQIKLSFVSV